MLNWRCNFLNAVSDAGNLRGVANLVLHAIIDWLDSTPERPDTQDLDEPIEGH
jgi:hypothetical protein